MESMILADAPKKVLSEAQRLAFLKGREKRMANIEKKKLENAEKEQSTIKPKPKTKVKQDRVLETEIAVEAKPKQEPEPEPKIEQKTNPVVIVDEPKIEPKAEPKFDADAFVKKVMSSIDNQLGDTLMERFMNAMNEHTINNSKPKVKRSRKTKSDDEDVPPKPKVKRSKTINPVIPPKPQAQQFTWL